MNEPSQARGDASSEDSAAQGASVADMAGGSDAGGRAAASQVSELAESEGSGSARHVMAKRRRPSFVFFAAVAAVCLLADVTSKAWAEVELTRRSPLEPMVIVEGHLNFALAYNRGGAWGLLQDASESVRRPFFLVVSLAAIAFIVSLYNKLLPDQRALRWGLPLVLGGALGNLADRITRGSVVDFIDYRGHWVESMNELIAKLVAGWHVTDHWPTFNVADISICVGVGLMAVDMLTSARRNAERQQRVSPSSPSPPHAAE